MRSFVLLLFVLLAALSAGAFDDTADIRALEEQWDAANLKGDAAVLDRILASDFIMTGDDGKVHAKAEVIAELKSRNISYQSAKTEDLRIILHGDAAVVSGRWRGIYKNHGKTVNLVERFTNFYVRRGGQWRCVASHGSAVK
jgi:ketosteroid isomerase-like protein